MIEKANLIVATQNNSARMAMSIDKAAKELITDGKVDDGRLNMVEMAFRAYDPCHACATHTLPGQMPLKVNIYDHHKELVKIMGLPDHLHLTFPSLSFWFNDILSF